MARNPRGVEIRDCTLAAGALALSVEVGAGQPCTLSLTGTSIDIAGAGAALSIWAPDICRPAAVRLRLEGNSVRAGRVLALRSLPGKVVVEASGNTFAFREALLSYTGFPSPESWRRAATWHGLGNAFHGARDWVLVDGAAPESPRLPRGSR